MKPTFLIVLAHPDDETITSGVMAQAVADGAQVILACATRGEAGEIADSSLATPENLGRVRERELREACQVLGVSDVHFLNYCDSGMAGTSVNQDPRSYIQAEPESVVSKIADIMREVQPDVVITFEPYGVYGHPDHQAICKHTTTAFDRLASDGNASKKLYYAGLPGIHFQGMRERMLATGRIPPELNQFPLDKEDAFGKTLTHIVDVSKEAKTKVVSVRCHLTQMGPDSSYTQLPDDMFEWFMSKEYFAQVRPSIGSDYPKTADVYTVLFP